jgi:3-hydroxyacyl-[acyl-carrier-protein] dehydratase
MRYVLLDRITALEPPARAVGVKCVSLSDDVFTDHFPGLPVMPGALILESLAQLGGVLLEATMRDQGHPELHAVLSTIERAKLRRAVRPGDRIELLVEGLRVSDLGGQVKGRASVDGRRVAEAELSFALIPIHEPLLVAQRKTLLAIWLARPPEEP